MKLNYGMSSFLVNAEQCETTSGMYAWNVFNINIVNAKMVLKKDELLSP